MRSFRSDRSNRHFNSLVRFSPLRARKSGLPFSELHYSRSNFPGHFPACLVDFQSSPFRRIIWQKKRVDQMNRGCVRSTSFFSGSNYSEIDLFENLAIATVEEREATPGYHTPPTTVGLIMKKSG